MLPLATRRPVARPILAALLLGVAAFARAASADWSVEITPDGDLFPVLDLSQRAPESAASPGGGNGLVIVRVRGEGILLLHRLRAALTVLAKAPSEKPSAFTT